MTWPCFPGDVISPAPLPLGHSPHSVASWLFPTSGPPWPPRGFLPHFLQHSLRFHILEDPHPPSPTTYLIATSRLFSSVHFPLYHLSLSLYVLCVSCCCLPPALEGPARSRHKAGSLAREGTPQSCATAVSPVIHACPSGSVWKIPRHRTRKGTGQPQGSSEGRAAEQSVQSSATRNRSKRSHEAGQTASKRREWQNDGWPHVKDTALTEARGKACGPRGLQGDPLHGLQMSHRK